MLCYVVLCWLFIHRENCEIGRHPSVASQQVTCFLLDRVSSIRETVGTPLRWVGPSLQQDLFFVQPKPHTMAAEQTNFDDFSTGCTIVADIFFSRFE